MFAFFLDWEEDWRVGNKPTLALENMQKGPAQELNPELSSYKGTKILFTVAGT